ncbi:MAG TPA: glucoamylase family protein [Chryseolinea sp.]|nr:glucoamylase family protein [Chryseolinea sp.]
MPRCEKDETAPGTLELLNVFLGTTAINIDGPATSDLPLDRTLSIAFSSALNQTSAESSIALRKSSGSDVDTELSFSNGDKTIVLHPAGLLDPNSTYILEVSDQLKGAKGEIFPGRTVEFKTTRSNMSITSVKTDGLEILNTQLPTDIAVENLEFEIAFSAALNPSTVNADAFSITGFASVPLSFELSNENKTVHVTATQKLSDLRKFQLVINNKVKGVNDEDFSPYAKEFYTQVDPTPDFPLISDEALLTLVQEQTFRYFWDFAQPNSGMARERNSSGDLVTSGGSGFGLMSMIVGIERNFITRSQGLERIEKIITFLESADRFHGAWSHWLDGNTGDVIPFSPNDNGGDLVETSFLIQGLLTVRQYLNAGVPAEDELIERINVLWQGVEWNWYTRGGEDVLYWHWSPDKEWVMNHQIRGYNEALITYVLAASSPTYGIVEDVYHEGWADNGSIANGKEFYGINLPLGTDYGGPLFFAHYSFLGLDPKGLNDIYGDYWVQNVNHTLINHAYSVDNPKNYIGYSDANWGLTASDNGQGYSAHSPTNDLGVISPTAAVSSILYTPEESMKAIKFFYYSIGDRLWGQYGFYDAFDLTENWTANSYLAIDQGPIIIMIENYRTGLLNDLFMSAPEVQDGLTKLGFN